MNRTQTVLFWACIIGAVFFAGFTIGAWYMDQKQVCHAITEDSVITDCDYRDGGWYKR